MPILENARHRRQVWAALVAVLPLLSLASTQQARAQKEYERLAAEYDRPQLYHEAIVLPGPDSAQAIIAFRIPHALLVFRQEGSGFVANVDLTVELYRDQQKVAERVWRGEKRVHSFE